MQFCRKKINYSGLTAVNRLNLMGQVRTDQHTILSPFEAPAAEVINPAGKAGICLVCEHASRMLPASLNHLGVKPEHHKSHAAWDIGARDLSVSLSRMLDSPLVASRVSRLVYDCNRPPDAPDAIPIKSEVVDIPGNANLSDAEKAARVTEIYEPFRKRLSETLDRFATPPVLVTIHSFTPLWFGKKRDVEIGLLHDSDDRLAKAMLEHAPEEIDTRLNAPYSATDGVTHTLLEHGISRGLQNVMIEVRNDLISDADGVAHITSTLSTMLAEALAPQEAT